MIKRRENLILPEKMMGFLDYKEKEYAFSFDYDDYILKLFPDKSHRKEQVFTCMTLVKSEHSEDTIPQKLSGNDYLGNEVTFFIESMGENINEFVQFKVDSFLYKRGEKGFQEFSEILVTGLEIDLFLEKNLKTVRNDNTLVIEGLDKEACVFPCGKFNYKSDIEVEMVIQSAISEDSGQISTTNLFQFIFSSPIKCEEIKDFYYEMLMFFKFLTGRQNISVKTFDLMTADFNSYAVYIKCLEYSSETHKDAKNTIISYDILREYTAVLFGMVHNGSFDNHYYPEMQKSKCTYSPSRKIFLLTNFEKEFREIYGINITRSNEYNQLKDDGEKVLEEWVKKYTGKQKTRAKKLVKAFLCLDLSYSERILYALQDCTDILEPFLQDTCFAEQVKEGTNDVFQEISETLADIRNDYAHGNLLYEDDTLMVRFESILVLDRLLYAMRLKFIGLPTLECKKAINVLFAHRFYFD